MAAPPLPRLLLLAVGAAAAAAGDGCTAGCDLALGSYTYLAGLIPFLLSRGQTYSSIANNYYNLTTADWLQKTNTYPPNNTPDTGTVNVTVNCSCGDASASPDYGLFLTYPLRDGKTLTSAAVNNGFSSPSQMDLLRKYNPGMDSVVGRGIVYIPVKAGGGGRRPSGERRRLARRRTRRTPPMARRWRRTCRTHAHRRHARRRTRPPWRDSGRWPAGVRRRHARRCMRPPWRGGSGRRPAGARWRHTRRHTRPHAHARARAHGFAGPGKGAPVGAIAGGAVAGVVALALGVLVYIMLYRRRKAKEAALLPSSEDSTQPASTLSMDEVTPSSTQAPDGASPVAGITVDKLVEFSYQELFNATEGFSIGNKIGQGGFGSVYYAELRGEKAAIKKMDRQATHEFLAELKVLTHVHHLNLVRLIGYCIESSLFLVYEFIENSNLSQHLRGTGYEPLSWPARVQIALDSARGLEYIHEHTVPVYVHRDIKSANILIDKNFRAKVADFGLTKLTDVGGTSLPARVVGTFGYMPPEYARYGDVSPKVDVYAFGVVLYELISAKEAIVRSTGSASDSRGLVYLFEEALTTPDPKEGLRKLVDRRLGEDYSIDSILKMTHLAKACTQEDPRLRPTMRSVVVALMTLSEFWDMNSLYENQGLVNLTSGR